MSKSGLHMTFEENDVHKSAVFEKIAQKDFCSKKYWFQVKKTQISLDLKIFCSNEIILKTIVDFSL